jgi:hypothetical protein
MFTEGSRTLLLKRVLRSLMLGDVDDAVDVERNFLCVGAPVLIVEAVRILSILLGVE